MRNGDTCAQVRSSKVLAQRDEVRQILNSAQTSPNVNIRMSFFYQPDSA